MNAAPTVPVSERVEGNTVAGRVTAIPAGEFSDLPLESVHESSTNPRHTFDEHAIEELTESVRQKGVLMPILVRPKKGKAFAFEVVAGARRLRAAQRAKLATIPARVVDLDDVQALEVAVIENLQRQDVHPLEEGEGYRQLIGTAKGYDVATIAAKVGRSVKYVYDRLRLLGLTKPAQEYFRSGDITAGHAVLLSRLSPADQARAIGKTEYDSGLFERERLLFVPGEKEGNKPVRKAVSVGELKAWVDKNVRFDDEAVEPMLFPETALALETSREKALKVVPITHDHYITPEAKEDGERTYGPMSWRRADGKHGSKTCERDRPVMGYIAVGPGRGESFEICIDKKGCKVHWAAEQRQSAQRSKAATKGASKEESRWQIEERRRKEEQARENAARDRWKKVLPDVLKALAERLKKAPAGATSQLAELLVKDVGSRFVPKDPGQYVPRGRSSEDLVRHLAFIALAADACDDWRGFREFPRQAKAFGVDVTPILKAAGPAVGASCRNCGCTEAKACDVGGQGCSWLVEPDTKTGKGLCSAAACAATRKPAPAKGPLARKAGRK